MDTIQVPKVQFFRTLLSNNCIHKEKVSAHETIYWVLMPHSGVIVPLREQRQGTFDEYSFLVDNPVLVSECLNANVQVLKLNQLIKALPSLVKSAITFTNGEDSAIIEINIRSMSTSNYCTLKNNAITCKVGTPQHSLLPSSVPEYPNATHFGWYINTDTKALSPESVLALWDTLPNIDRPIFNKLWRYGVMEKNNENNFDRITSEDILVHTLYLGAGQSEAHPFAMICALEINVEDKDLFKSAFNLGWCTYTAIGRPQLKSRMVVDEDIFLAIIRENPTCKTVAKLYMDLAQKKTKQQVPFRS